MPFLTYTRKIDFAYHFLFFIGKVKNSIQNPFYALSKLAEETKIHLYLKFQGFTISQRCKTYTLCSNTPCTNRNRLLLFHIFCERKKDSI